MDRAVSERLNQIHQVQKERFNKKKNRRNPFSQGDMVWVMRPKPVGGHKIQTGWLGPFPVEDRIGTSSYRVQLKAGELLSVHLDQMKAFHRDVTTQGIPLSFSSEIDGERRPVPNLALVRAHRRDPSGRLEFLVHLEGSSNRLDSWECINGVISIPICVVKYCLENGLLTEVMMPIPGVKPTL